MGKIMGAIKKGYSETIDFSIASIIIKDLLNKNEEISERIFRRN